MSENYIVINGKKAELTEEQMKQLGINVEEKKETPFTRHPDELYWYINAMNSVTGQHDHNDDFDNVVYNNVNYFNDYKFARQVILHQLLYRKLLKYAYDTDTISKWNDERDDYGDSLKHYFISRNYNIITYAVDYTVHRKHLNTVYFCSEKAAWDAIDKVIYPFEREHPEFIW